MPICKVGEVGREKTREGEEIRGRMLGQEGWLGLNDRELSASHSGAELGAKIYGAKLGAKVTDAELTAMSSTVPRSSALETLAPSINGAELKVHFLNFFCQGSICDKLSKKG